MNLELALLGAHIDPDYSPTLALAEWRAFRIANGWAPRARFLSWPGVNLKLRKDKVRATLGLSLAPAFSSGIANVCSHSTPVCRAGCLAFNGNGRYAETRDARSLRVGFVLANPSAALALVSEELRLAARKYGRIACRLNVFSDIPWEVVAPWLFARHRYVRFYDYTKNWRRRVLPKNYHLTYSVSERTPVNAAVARVLTGRNIAVVFDHRRPLPATWCGLAVVDGDANDARYRDRRPVVVGLKAKGRMRRTAMVRG